MHVIIKKLSTARSNTIYDALKCCLSLKLSISFRKMAYKLGENQSFYDRFTPLDMLMSKRNKN